MKKSVKIAICVFFVICIAVVAVINIREFCLNKKYNTAIALMEDDKYREAIEIFKNLEDYEDSKENLTKAYIGEAERLFNNGKKIDAYAILNESSENDDIRELKEEFLLGIRRDFSEKLSVGVRSTAMVNPDGTVIVKGWEEPGGGNVDDWENVISISTSTWITGAIKEDGTVIFTGGRNDWPGHDIQYNTVTWTDITAISAGGGSHLVGLHKDGTVSATGPKWYFEGVENWHDVTQISAGGNHTVGLRSNGTVVATGYNNYGQCNVGDWKDIVEVVAGCEYTIGLKSDGTVVATGNSRYFKGFHEWKDIVSVSGYSGTVGLKSDGTIVIAGEEDVYGMQDAKEWKDILAVSSRGMHIVGLKSDGTIVTSGYNGDGQCDIESWRLFQ